MEAKNASTTFDASLTARVEDEDVSFELHGDGAADFTDGYSVETLDLSDLVRRLEDLAGPEVTDRLGNPDAWKGKVVEWRGITYAHMAAYRHLHPTLRKPWVEVGPEDLHALGIDTSHPLDFVLLLGAATRASKAAASEYDVEIPIGHAERTLGAVARRLHVYLRSRRRLGLDPIRLRVALDGRGRVARITETLRLRQKLGRLPGEAAGTVELGFDRYGISRPPFELPPPAAVAPGSLLAKRHAGHALVAAALRTLRTTARVAELQTSPRSPPARFGGVFDFARRVGRIVSVGSAGHETRYFGGVRYERPTFVDLPWTRCRPTTLHAYANAVDPLTMLRAIARTGASFAVAGDHYHGTLNPGALLGRATVDVWTADRRHVTRIRVAIPGVVVTTSLSAFGRPVHVARPAGRVRAGTCVSG